MTDLTKIEKPFGMLDEETREALVIHWENGGLLEWYGFTGEWTNCDAEPEFCNGYTYRAKHLQLPEWPAGLLPKLWWLTMDSDGAIHVHSEEPYASFNYWSSPDRRRIDHLITISFDGIPWEQAIIERPEDEE